MIEDKSRKNNVSKTENKVRPISKHKSYDRYKPQDKDSVYTEYPIYSHPYTTKIQEERYSPLPKKPPKRLKSLKESEPRLNTPKQAKYARTRITEVDERYGNEYDFSYLSHTFPTPPPPPVTPPIPPYIPPHAPSFGPYYPPPHPSHPPPPSPPPPTLQYTTHHFPGYPPHLSYPFQYSQPKLFKPFSEMPLILIFLVCITVYWLPYIAANLIGVPFYTINPDLAEVVAGIALCVLSIALMLLIRSNLDKPSLKDYGLTTENLGNNLIFTVKLIFIIYAIEWLAIYIFQHLGVSFEGGPAEINIFFIISAVIIAPIFEETVYRVNASTLLARRLPIIWVAIITSTWFIAKHLPMWHFDDKFGLPALGVILMVDIPLWTIVTYYYLKRNCIWIPFFVHMFNNASIALFYYLPEFYGTITDYLFLIIGVLFIIAFGLPWLYKNVVTKYLKGVFQVTTKDTQNMAISLGLIILFLITSEALISVQNINEYVCLPIGLGFILLSIITIGFVLSNRTVVYVKDNINIYKT